MEENERKIEWAGELREYFSATVSSAAFWTIAFLWNVVFRELDPIPRLGLGAALSWVVFLHAEVMGMILMSMMRRRVRAEGIEEGMARTREEMRKVARAEVKDALAEARAEVRTAQAAAREAQAEAKETQAEARAEAKEAQAAAREAQAEARAAQAEARAEAKEAWLEARESREIIRDLERQLREARGESDNGA